MCPSKKYKQLRFPLEVTRQHYHNLSLRFRWGNQLVEGVLHGDCGDWYFTSQSAAFTQSVPGGSLRKYMLWIDAIPQNIGLLYNAIWEAAALKGYSMLEREESV